MSVVSLVKDLSMKKFNVITGGMFCGFCLFNAVVSACLW